LCSPIPAFQNEKSLFPKKISNFFQNRLTKPPVPPSNEYTKLFQGGTLMKTRKIISLFLAAVLLAVTLYACGQSEQDKLYDELTKKSSSSEPVPVVTSAPESSTISSEAEPTPEPTPYVDPEGLEGEFTLLCYRKIGAVGIKDQPEALAEEFMKLHPGVTVNVEFFTDINAPGTPAEKRSSYAARVRAELGSGEADYVLYQPLEELNLYGLSKNGIFIDLRPYFDNDPNINPDDYYTPVLDALSIDGKLTTMPISFSFEGLYLNRKVMESLDVDADAIATVNYKDVLGWYDQAKAADLDLQPVFGAELASRFYTYESPAYFDVVNKEASFQSPEFIEYLTRTGAIEEADKSLGFIARGALTVPGKVERALLYWDTGERTEPEATDEFTEEIFADAHPGVAAVAAVTPEYLGHLSAPLTYLAGPYPAVSTKGQLGVYTTEDFAVPASMKNPDLAWKFISYCIGEREDVKAGNDFFTWDIPINAKNFSKLVDAMKNSPWTYVEERHCGYKSDKIDGEVSAQKLEEFMALPLINSKVYVIDMSEYLTEFYDNKLTTPEQCAEKIQGRAYIWLNE